MAKLCQGVRLGDPLRRGQRILSEFDLKEAIRLWRLADPLEMDRVDLRVLRFRVTVACRFMSVADPRGE